MNKLGRITITFLLALTGLGVQAKIITYPVPPFYVYFKKKFGPCLQFSC